MCPLQLDLGLTHRQNRAPRFLVILTSLLAVLLLPHFATTILAMSYNYTPLTSQDSIRILKVRPARYESEDVDCELIETQLHVSSPGNTISDGKNDPYEAVSWCWGKEDPATYLPLRIHETTTSNTSTFLVSPTLHIALRCLRYPDKMRSLWIDAICINQRCIAERNHQVSKMGLVYGEAKNVCIWLGDTDEDSRTALTFIRNQVLELWGFDRLCENLNMSEQWRSLIILMKRPWFSRRWVIQEIALAHSGTLYCGRDSIPWQDFADAISLFVEVESATHRLSEVMKKNVKFHHIPEFFADVPWLGAALLVDATSNLFRSSNLGKREPLSSLEYLVSKLSVFDASEPKDIIYALLAIAKDTTPKSKSSARSRIEASLETLGDGLYSESYPVDYSLQVIDIYKNFVEFSIRRSDRTRALDIICRPWAPSLDRNTSDIVNNVEENRDLPSWIPSLDEASHKMTSHPQIGIRMQRNNADILVGLPGFGQRNYNAAGTKEVNLSKIRFDKKSSYYSLSVEGFILDTIGKIQGSAALGNIPFKWLNAGGWKNVDSDDPPPEFWRTLVADRGPNGQNPPTYYPRALGLCFKMKGIRRGSLDTAELINDGQCSIVAEFLRRVQAVIWNRRLIRTGNGHLGLAHEEAEPDDYICILYGCSVPVILRRIQKSIAEIEEEQRELKERT